MLGACILQGMILTCTDAQLEIFSVVKHRTASLGPITVEMERVFPGEVRGLGVSVSGDR